MICSQRYYELVRKSMLYDNCPRTNLPHIQRTVNIEQANHRILTATDTVLHQDRSPQNHLITLVLALVLQPQYWFWSWSCGFKHYYTAKLSLVCSSNCPPNSGKPETKKSRREKMGKSINLLFCPSLTKVSYAHGLCTVFADLTSTTNQTATPI